MLTYKHLRCWVVHIQGLEDGCAIICHHHVLPSAHALQDFVLQSNAVTFRAKSHSVSKTGLHVMLQTRDLR